MVGALKWNEIVFVFRDLKVESQINETIGQYEDKECVRNTKKRLRTLRFDSHHLPPVNWVALSAFLLLCLSATRVK